MKKVITKYENWLVSTFKGSTPKESLKLFINQLLEKTNQTQLPIKLSKIAAFMGLNPIPVFNENQTFDGEMIFVNKKLRISIKELDFKLERPRNRFSYAHELIHCFGYKLNSDTDIRIAPSPKTTYDIQKEEELCNYGAANLLLPIKFLELEVKLLNAKKNLDKPDILNHIKKKAKVSEQTALIQFFSQDAFFERNSLTIISNLCKGTNNKGEIKLRSIFCKYLDSSGENKPFLKPNQGVDHIKSQNDAIPWSLIRFKNSNLDIMHIQNELIFNNNTKLMYFISGYHKRIGLNYVWSELSIKAI